jgi:hypothetical protein
MQQLMIENEDTMKSFSWGSIAVMHDMTFVSQKITVQTCPLCVGRSVGN